MARVTSAPEATPAVAPGDEDARPEPSVSRRRWPGSSSVPTGRARFVAAFLGLLLVAVVAVLVTRSSGTQPLTQRDVDTRVTRGLEAQAEAAARAPADASVAYATIQPSLVLITTRGGAGEGSGAGVVVNTDGLILTALHVVAETDSITVAFPDGTRSPARITTRQPENDIATLVAEQPPQTVVPAVLGGGVAVGAPVFAVGHPLGLTNSLSAGVVSALDRSVRVDGDQRLEHLIQFDAAVNPGNSGGPLLNRAGHVVGIVTGLANPNEGSFVGVGFAVPIGTAGGAAGGPPR